MKRIEEEHTLQEAEELSYLSVILVIFIIPFALSFLGSYFLSILFNFLYVSHSSVFTNIREDHRLPCSVSNLHASTETLAGFSLSNLLIVFHKSYIYTIGFGFNLPDAYPNL